MAGLLNGKAIIVTGGSTGIGRATALRCADEGALVTVADINTRDGQMVVDEINRTGGQAQFIETDVTRADQVKGMIAACVGAYGQINGAFNNAGIEGSQKSIVKMSEQDFDRTLAVDLKSVWLCVKYQIEQFRKQGSSGSIVNNASAAGLVGHRGLSDYCAAKHGVIGLTKCVALECARKDIRINAVCPGFIETPMVDRMNAAISVPRQSLIDQEPMARLGRPTEVAEAVIWLLSDQSSFVTGIALPVDGGLIAM
jgi:NAD(P)-dependent dehydrogenase (short-subunit alcohol dehydrogenase family)